MYVPEWLGDVYVTTLQAIEQDAFEETCTTGRGKKTKSNIANIRARYCALTIVNEKGERLFSKTDVVALGKKSAGALGRCFEVAQRLNGMTDEDVEELAKNALTAPGDGSSSS